jgi:signal transduction histidine kinase
VADLTDAMARLAGRTSVRLRTTLGATLVVAVALLVGAVVFVGIVQRSLADEVLASVSLRATDMRAMFQSGALPSRLVSEPTEDEFLQVIDDDGRVVAASANLEGEPPVAVLSPGRWTTTSVPYDDEPFLAYAVAVTSGDNRYVLILGRTLESVAEATELVSLLLGFGLPLLLVLVAGTTWVVVGWALSPVERIGREVDAISAAELHRRVPQPATDDEIGRLAKTMNRMLDRLERAQLRQRQFVSDTSHELRSPIASIRQQAEVALAHPDRASVGQLAEGVLAEELRLQRLVEDLLLLARADEHSLRLASRPVDLDDLVFEAAGRLRETTSLRIDSSAVSAGRTIGDQSALRRVVDNLADNAARHAASTVAFSLGETDGEVLLRIDDDGTGIPPVDRERVFERFVRLDDARSRDGGGAGLGLAIVAEVVAAHRGSVAITESPQGGVRVEIRLPVAADPLG